MSYLENYGTKVDIMCWKQSLPFQHNCQCYFCIHNGTGYRKQNLHNAVACGQRLHHLCFTYCLFCCGWRHYHCCATALRCDWHFDVNDSDWGDGFVGERSLACYYESTEAQLRGWAARWSALTVWTFVTGRAKNIVYTIHREHWGRATS